MFWHQKYRDALSKRFENQSPENEERKRKDFIIVFAAIIFVLLFMFGLYILFMYLK